MKKFLSLTIGLIILFTSVLAFAQMDEKLEGHWSKDMIQREFVAYYFSYLARKDFERLDPNESISNRDFSLSLSSLAKDYDLDYTSNNIISNKRLTRKEVVKTIGNKLAQIEDLRRGNEEIPFTDIDTMDEESLEALRLLYNLEIIKGVSKDKFAPDRIMTQAEAIITLQRVKEVLDTKDHVLFTTKGVVSSYNDQEAIIASEKDDKLLVTITKEFSTPGYGISIDKIVREDNNEYQVYLNITPPNPNSEQLQVITYKTITVEIEKTELKGEGPYVFIVEGIKSNLLR